MGFIQGVPAASHLYRFEFSMQIPPDMLSQKARRWVPAHRYKKRKTPVKILEYI